MPILLRALLLSEIEIKESNLFFFFVCVSMCIYVFIYVYWCVSVFFSPPSSVSLIHKSLPMSAARRKEMQVGLLAP